MNEPGLYLVTAELATAMASAHQLNLDGVVIAATAPPDTPLPTRQSPEAPELWDIPIGRVRHDGMTVFLSSNVILPADAAYEQLNWTGRRDAQDVARLTRKFNRGGGPDRDKIGRARLTSARAAQWVVWSDAPDELLDILRMRVDSLGGLRAHGHGRVRSWDLAPVGNDPPAGYAPWGPEGALLEPRRMRTLRALPASWLADEVAATPLPVRPPYWHLTSMTPAAPAGVHAPGGLAPDLAAKLAGDAGGWMRPETPAEMPPYVAGLFGFPPVER